MNSCVKTQIKIFGSTLDGFECVKLACLTVIEDTANNFNRYIKFGFCTLLVNCDRIKLQIHLH